MAFHVLRKPLASGHTPGYLVVIYRIFIEFPGSRYRVFRATFASRVLFFGGGGGRVGFQPTGCFRVPTIDTCSPSFHRFLLLRPITLVTRVLFFFCVFPHISFPVPLQLIDSIHRLFLLCSPTRTVWHFFLPSFLFFFTFFHYRNPF